MACGLGERGPCYFCGLDGECCRVCGEYLCAAHEMLTPGNVTRRVVGAIGKAIGVRPTLFPGAPTPSNKPTIR